MATAYVFNGMRDLTGERALMFDGRKFEFPLGKVTQVPDQVFTAPDTYRRNMPNASPADKQAVHESHMEGITFCHTLFRRQYVDFMASGLWVGERAPVPSEIEATKKLGEQWWRDYIDECIQERISRQSGDKGRLKLDAETIEKMKELGIHDPIHNPIKTMGTAEIQTIATVVAATMKEMAEPAGAKK